MEKERFKMKTVYVDIDETICRSPESRDYSLAIPIVDHIHKINELYDAGVEIVYWTARGTGSGIDWREITEKQFEKWGVKYHELCIKGHNGDYFIDDRGINAEDFFK